MTHHAVKGRLSRALRRRLEGTQGLVIIDEADHLGAEVLERTPPVTGINPYWPCADGKSPGLFKYDGG
ncbi:putative phage DNA transposition protein [Escherichia coli]|uniref:Putative phage DNA transposition protein n=1 Tax=Escherichia coli TaxID=562 RepID=A0A2X3LV32_ECOLX|nr:putative phage DNA transposition protein [Escherichia coli]